MNKILKVASVSKKYNKQYVLNNISFELKEGEILGLVGPNGAGKTTLMRIIIGLIKNFDGVINLNLDAKNIKKDGKIFGCIIETPKFYPYMSGYQNLKFFSSLAYSWKKNIKDINQIICFMGLSSVIKNKVKTYSLGMRQRLGLAQALIGNPKILVLDEPTNGLDPDGVAEIRNYLKKIVSEKKISVLISSHTLSEIERLCDRVLILKKGNLSKIIDMHEETFEDSIFAFETDEIDSFMDVLKKKNIVIYEAKNNIIKIFLSKDKLSGFIKDLVLKDISFRSIYEIKETLEDKFLDLTGGNKID